MTHKSDKVVCRVWSYWISFACNDCNCEVVCYAGDIGKRVYCPRCHSAYRVTIVDGIEIRQVERVR